MRKRWDRGHGIKDGKKLCLDCDIWLPADTDHFYWIKKDNRLHSYCKPCGTTRAIKSGKTSRQNRKDQAASYKRDRLSHNAQSRMILEEAANLIAGKFPDLEIVYEIQAHLSIGKRLFGE